VSRNCIKCKCGISSADSNATEDMCSSCQLDTYEDERTQLADDIVIALVEGCDVQHATELAIEYQDKYL